MFCGISFLSSRCKTKPKRILCLKCDLCSCEFERKFTIKESQKEYHWCSRNCQQQSQRKGGINAEKKRLTFQRKYGVDNAQQIKHVRKKTTSTNIERYGSACPMQSEKVLDQIEEKHGVRHYIQSPEFLKKAEKTWGEKYGVRHPMKSDDVKSKYDFSSIWKKAHQTKKLNGSYVASKAENCFYERLVQLFENVKRQVLIKHDNGHWSIDFRIGEVYVQFDGAYWHGVDRPIEEIKTLKNIRDQAIRRAYQRDREQDAWFSKQGLNLVRITDCQASSLSDNELKTLLTCS